MENNIKLNLEGFFSIYKSRSPYFEKCEKIAEFSNRILNGGLRMFATSSTFLQYCHIGSNGDENISSQSGLNSPLISSGDRTGLSEFTGTGEEADGSVYSYRRITIRFSPDGNVRNISECGFGPTSQNNLFNRALIRDSNGLPTTVTQLSDEYIYFTYELRLYPPLEIFEGTFDFEGQTHTWKMQAGALTGEIHKDYWNLKGNFLGGGYYSKISSHGLPPLFAQAVSYDKAGPTMAGAGSLGSVGANGKLIIRFPEYSGPAPISLLTVVPSGSESGAFCWNIEITPPLINMQGRLLEFSVNMTWGTT